MYKSHKIMCLFLFFIIFLLSFYLDIEINAEAKSNMLTVVSIMLGFTMTGLTVMIGQDFAKRLNKKIDMHSPLKQTQLQTLAVYFYGSFNVGILIIVLLIILGLIPNNNVKNLHLFIKIINSVILAMFGINFFLIRLLWKVLIQLFHKSVE